jgi:acetylornithine deacetylase/succinyl-diaminopimelate desuccinylase-like protein
MADCFAKECSMPQSAETLNAVLACIDAGLDQSLERLFELLRIPSISTDTAYAADCRRAADWLREAIAEIGFKASVRDTAGHPMVLGKAAGGAGPHVLFYGHYDVQPVDPLSLWEKPPFEPQVVDGRIRARGASDDKGQLLTFIEACRAFKAVTGTLPVGVTLLFEGEEEAGSKSLPDFLDRAAAEL